MGITQELIEDVAAELQNGSVTTTAYPQKPGINLLRDQLLAYDIVQMACLALIGALPNVGYGL